MAKQYTVKLFKNTGFNSGNIPDNSSLLQNVAQVTTLTPKAWKRQDYLLSYIKLALTWDEVKETDYLSIQAESETEYFYFVNDILMTTEKTAILSIDLDEITTMGGASSLEWTGWIKRCHCKTDEMFENNAPEPFEQVDPWTYGDGEPIVTTSESDPGRFVGSTAEITGTDGIVNNKEGVTFTDPLTMEKMMMPTTKKLTHETEFFTYNLQGSYLNRSFKFPNVCFYDGNDANVNEGVNILRTMGAEASILYSYIIPREYIESVGPGQNADYLRITGSHGVFQSNNPFKWKNDIKNNKVFSGQFSKYVLECPASGNYAEYQAHEIRNTHLQTLETAPQFLFFADPQPEGRPYFRPFCYKGNLNDLFTGAVPGMSWLNTPIAYATRSGEAVDRANLAISQDLAARRLEIEQTHAVHEYNAGLSKEFLSKSFNLAKGAATKDLSVVPEVLDMFGNVAKKSVFEEGLQNERTLYELALNAERNKLSLKNATKPIEIAFPVAGGTQNYGSNIGVVHHLHISEADAQRLDDFFSAYGYATNERMTGDVFTGREKHNYVEANASVINDNFPMYLRERAALRISAGVRVWHVKPTETDLYNNPITQPTP